MTRLGATQNDRSRAGTDLGGGAGKLPRLTPRTIAIRQFLNRWFHNQRVGLRAQALWVACWAIWSRQAVVVAAVA